ncbi:hypothetical protein E2C01_014039 [Portunus trituberculatus]|uniref:Uncharacterized protein n=1 Tax=Portunus trituberculatus TaxID=210409 RepID=A0A5B7DJ07_PORTR|nr:hypothetical protein [Portunus trituberculatus]
MQRGTCTPAGQGTQGATPILRNTNKKATLHIGSLHTGGPLVLTQVFPNILVTKASIVNSPDEAPASPGRRNKSQLEREWPQSVWCVLRRDRRVSRRGNSPKIYLCHKRDTKYRIHLTIITADCAKIGAAPQPTKARREAPRL